MSNLKICIVAPPSCDKTTTAREVVKILKKQHRINAEVAEEYARKYTRDNYDDLDDNHPIYDPHQQYPIMLGQIEVEDKVSRRHDVTICDSSTFLGYVYARAMVTGLPKTMRHKPMYQKLLKDLHEMSLQQLPSYDSVFLFEPTGFVFQDGVRSQKDADQAPLFTRIKGFLDAEGVKYTQLSGTAEEKAQEIVAHILGLVRFQQATGEHMYHAAEAKA